MLSSQTEVEVQQTKEVMYISGHCAVADLGHHSRRNESATVMYREIAGRRAEIYICAICRATRSRTVWKALMTVCSLMTISVVSAFGLLTRDAMAVESVSIMIL